MKALLSATTFTAKIAIVAAAALGGTALVSSSVFASLSAAATGLTSVSTGTLALTQGSTTLAGTPTLVSGGISTGITSMAPGDTVNRFIDLSNSTSTLNAISPKISLSPGVSNALTSFAAAGYGLQIAIQSCPVSWTYVLSVPTCVGGGSAYALGALGTPVSAYSLTTTAAPNGVAITLPTTNAGSVSHLQISISLPAGNEIVTDGTSNLTGTTGSVLGISGTVLTWNFSETLRTGLTTNS